MKRRWKYGKVPFVKGKRERSEAITGNGRNAAQRKDEEEADEEEREAR